jgi:hypothetical protein
MSDRQRADVRATGFLFTPTEAGRQARLLFLGVAPAMVLFSILIELGFRSGWYAASLRTTLPDYPA